MLEMRLTLQFLIRSHYSKHYTHRWHSALITDPHEGNVSLKNFEIPSKIQEIRLQILSLWRAKHRTVGLYLFFHYPLGILDRTAYLRWWNQKGLRFLCMSLILIRFFCNRFLSHIHPPLYEDPPLLYHKVSAHCRRAEQLRPSVSSASGEWGRLFPPLLRFWIDWMNSWEERQQKRFYRELNPEPDHFQSGFQDIKD